METVGTIWWDDTNPNEEGWYWKVESGDQVVSGICLCPDTAREECINCGCSPDKIVAKPVGA